MVSRWKRISAFAERLNDLALKKGQLPEEKASPRLSL